MSAKSLSQKGSSHIIIVMVIVITIIGALGFVFWNNFLKIKTSSDIQFAMSREIEECLKRFDEKNPNDPGVSDHRDKSECYPNIVAAESLSQIQVDENNRNNEIISEAIAAKNDRQCNDVKGAYYTPYPPNITKVMLNTEEEAKKQCQVRVRSMIARDERQAELSSQYFELPDWDIYLKWKEDSDQIRFYPTNRDSEGKPKTYEFTTKNIEELNNCENKNGRLGAITRERDPQKVGKGTYLQTKIGDYYYYDTDPEVLCISNNSVTPSSANQARVLVRSMITGAQSQPNF